MPRAKKTEEAVVEAATETTVEKKATTDDFKQAAIDLGMRICKDFDKGLARPDAPLVNALTELYKAVKE